MQFHLWPNRKTSRTNRPSQPRRVRPCLEPLEDRLVLSTLHWSGASDQSSKWSDVANWQETKAPVAGDDLVFDAGALQLANTNDYAANTRFGSIQFEGASYTLSGNAISLGAVGISSTVQGTNSVAFDIAMPATAKVSAASGATLALRGALSGAGGLTKEGAGTVQLSGKQANTYAGTTTVTGGTLLLNKSDGTKGITAVPHALVIGQGTGADVVRLAADGQIADTAAVTVNSTGHLDLGSKSDAIGNLTMTGGQVTGTGTLTLNGEVTATSASATNPATISAALSLGTATRSVTVTQGPAAADLVIDGVISGGAGVGLTKAGAGTLEFAGAQSNTYAGTTTVNAGTLRLNKSVNIHAVSGPLVIGDGTGTDVVATASALQLSRSSTVTVNSSGQLNLGGDFEQTSSLTMTGGDVLLNDNYFSILGAVTATSASATNPAQILGIRGSHLHLSNIATCDVRAGLGGPDLIISAPISGVKVSLTKTGAGTLRFAGNLNNQIEGTTLVKAGVVEFAKTEGAQAVTVGSLVIGDGTGGANPARVRLLNPDQIRNTVPVTVNSDGVLALNNKNDTIGSLTMTGGHVTTGNGILTLNGDVTASAAAANDPAQISSRLSLGSATRTFNTAPEIPGTPALIVCAEILGAAGVGLTKVGAGTLRFEGSAANSYLGTTTVAAGVLELKKSAGNAVAGPLVIGDATGDANAEVQLLAANQFLDTKPVTVNSSGLFNLGSFSDKIGHLTMTGGKVAIGSTATLTLNGNVTATSTASQPATITGGQLNLGTAARTFTVNKGDFAGAALVIDGTLSARTGLIKEGAGTLLVRGPNSSVVAATVNAGTLRLDGDQRNTTVLLNAGTLEATRIHQITTGPDAANTVRVATPSSFGLLETTNTVNFSPKTTFAVKVKGGLAPRRGVDFDQLVVGTSNQREVDLNGAKLEVVAPADFVRPGTDTRFRIISGSVIGEFSNVPNTGTRLLRVPVQGQDGRAALFRVDYFDAGVDLVFQGMVS